MNNLKRVHSPSFKAQVALDMIKGIDTTSGICFKHGIHPTQAGKWRSQAMTGLA